MAEYIEREALKKRMFSYYDCVNENTSKSDYRGETLMNYEVADMIEDCIDNAPAADVVPRAEVERLKKIIEHYNELEQGCIVSGYNNIRAVAKQEVIKEYQDRLLKKIRANQRYHGWYVRAKINEIAEEMLGEGK